MKKLIEITQYDFGVMYFDNTKNVLFSEVIPKIKTGEISENFLMTRMPYETGALLCLAMDALQITDWQGKLNSQTLDNRTTLFAIIKEYIS